MLSWKNQTYLAALLLAMGCGNQTVPDLGRLLNPNGANGPIGNWAIGFSPSYYTFGSVVYNVGSEQTTITVSNIASEPVYIASLEGTNAHYAVIGDNCPRSPQAFGASQSCSVTLLFAPKTSGVLTTSLVATYGTAPGGGSLVSTMSASGTGKTLFAGLDSITGISGTSLTLNWASNSAAANYLVLQVVGSTSVFVATVAAPATSKTIFGLTPNTSYTYKVQMIDTSGFNDANTKTLTATTLSQPSGSLDTNLNFTGMAESAPLPTSVNAGAKAVAIQPDGKIVVGGFVYNTTASFNTFAMTRFNSDGSIDNTFWDSDINTTVGNVVTKRTPNLDEIRSLIILGDGSILAGGVGGVIGSWKAGVIRKYTSTGAVDSSFGTSGGVSFNHLYGAGSPLDFDAHAMAVQPDGKIFLSGVTYGPPVSTSRSATLVRFEATGAVDTTFGNAAAGGFYLAVPNGTFGSQQPYTGVALQSDGKAVCSGYVTNATAIPSKNSLLIARHLLDGTARDNTFVGANGYWLFNTGGTDERLQAIAIQSDGKIVAAGYTNNGGFNKFLVVRLLSTGAPDTSFGTNGIVTTTIGSIDARAYGLVIRPSDGKITVAGVSYLSAGDSEFTLVRYNTDGSIDSTFGTSGIATTSFGSGLDTGAAIAQQSDGKTVTAGTITSGAVTKMGITRQWQ